MEIDQIFNKTERFLSKCAAVPILGTPFGVIKVLIGSGQLITGLALGILSLPLRFTKHFALNDHCWKHVKHGLGNIVVGIFEAVPLVGLVIHIVRKKRATLQLDLDCNDDDFKNSYAVRCTNHEDKFMPYQSLVKRDAIWINYNLSQEKITWRMDYPWGHDYNSIDKLPPSLKPGYHVR